MSTYELDDDQVRAMLPDLRGGLGGELACGFADALEGQLPIPVPTKIGAVVRTKDGRTWIRADVSNAGCWISTDGYGDGWCNVPIGRIDKVLSEGVDL